MFLFTRLTTLVYLMRHPAVPSWLKLLPVIAVAYVVFPFDFLRDFIPVVGLIDDVWVFFILITIFMMWGGSYASRTPKDGGTTITTTYDVLDPPEDEDEKE